MVDLFHNKCYNIYLIYQLSAPLQLTPTDWNYSMHVLAFYIPVAMLLLAIAIYYILLSLTGVLMVEKDSSIYVRSVVATILAGICVSLVLLIAGYASAISGIFATVAMLLALLTGAFIRASIIEARDDRKRSS